MLEKISKLGSRSPPGRMGTEWMNPGKTDSVLLPKHVPFLLLPPPFSAPHFGAHIWGISCSLPPPSPPSLPSPWERRAEEREGGDMEEESHARKKLGWVGVVVWH